jgi:hypothetical protein
MALRVYHVLHNPPRVLDWKMGFLENNSTANNSNLVSCVAVSHEPCSTNAVEDSKKPRLCALHIIQRRRYLRCTRCTWLGDIQDPRALAKTGSVLYLISPNDWTGPINITLVYFGLFLVFHPRFLFYSQIIFKKSSFSKKWTCICILWWFLNFINDEPAMALNPTTYRVSEKTLERSTHPS